MVIQETSDTPVETPVIYNSDMECETNQVLQEDRESSKQRIKSRKRPKSKQISGDSSSSTVINPSDLEELKSVYKKCKEVVKKIETKYGHLINVDNDNTEPEQTKCMCTFNKKIVFDDNGKQSTQDIIPELHICPKRQKYNNCSTSTAKIQHPNIQIEEASFLNSLPDDIKELCEMLKDPNLDIVYRNRVTEKIKQIRYDNINTMRFDRKLIVEKLKQQPDEIMEFNGSNLLSLPGYPTIPR